MILLQAMETETVKVVWDLRYWLIQTFSLFENKTAIAIVTAIAALFCVVIPYLLGSISPAILISRAVYRRDIRRFGSKNAGTTNMLRTYGKKAAVLTFVLDLSKAAVSVLLGRLILGVDGAALAGFFVVFGHMFPLYHRFKGGKGVACLAMVILLIDPVTFLFILGIFLVVVIGTHYVSLASVMGALLYPLILHAFANDGLNVAMAILSSVFVVYMHRENLKRLWAGQESKLDFSMFKIKKKEKPTNQEGSDETHHE